MNSLRVLQDFSLALWSTWKPWTFGHASGTDVPTSQIDFPRLARPLLHWCRSSPGVILLQDL